jgi:hypothetical protein
MFKRANAIAPGLAALLLTACASKDGWMGADREKSYDAELTAKRLTEVVNNDDYFELHQDNSIYVFTDAKSYQIWLSTDEIPLLVTKFRVGPKGEKGKFQLVKNETKAMETNVGFKGASQKMYEGQLGGMAKGFFGFVFQEDSNTYTVFDNWNALRGFKSGTPADGYTVANGPKGAKVVYAGAAAAPAELVAKFDKLHAAK